MESKMTNKTDVAVSKFQDGYNCAQSVLYSFCDELGINKNTALKLVCGLGAGISRKQEVCGAVSGGIVVIGAKYGKGENGDNTEKEFTYKKTNELMDCFAQKHGSYLCRHLLDNCILSTPEGQATYKEKKLNITQCTPCIQSVIEILERIL
jgi:C_GCAxxG_C_C family probable redox protein